MAFSIGIEPTSYRLGGVIRHFLNTKEIKAGKEFTKIKVAKKWLEIR